MSETYKEIAALVFPFLDAGQRGIESPPLIEGRQEDCLRWYELGANWSKHHKTYKNAEGA